MVLPFAQLLGNFAWSFAHVTLPLSITEISPYDALRHLGRGGAAADARP